MKTLKTLFIALAIPALLLAAAGCKEPEVEKNPPTNITVTKADGSELSGTLTLEVDGVVELAVSALRATSYDWDVEDSATVELVEDNGATAKFKGKAAGTTNIVAYARNRDGAISTQVPVTVYVTPSLTLTVKSEGTEVTSLPMNVGDSKTLTTDVSETGATVTWESSDTSVVTVSDGVVSAVAVGSATITVTASKTNFLSATKNVSVTVTDPTLPNLTVAVKNGSVVVDDDNGIELIAGTGITLTAEASSNSTPVNEVIFTWESDDEDTATVNNGTVTAVNTGNTTITVTASKAGYNPGYLEFTVTVTPVPTLPWTWAKTPAWTSLTNGNNNTFFSTGRNDITIRVYGGTIGNDNGGIRLGASGSTGPARLVIGQSGNVSTASTDTVSTINGDFNLAEGPVKVTVEYENLAVATADRYLFRVYVNNNGTGQDASFLRSASNIASYGKGDLTETSGTIEVIIDPSSFTAEQLPALEKAFICFHSQQSNATGEDNGLTITSIKIEQIQTAGIIIGEEADFSGFPTETITLEDDVTITLSGSGYTTADWYIDGIKQPNAGLAFTISKNNYTPGEDHSLTAVVIVNGRLYSKTVKFTVAE